MAKSTKNTQSTCDCVVGILSWEDRASTIGEILSSCKDGTPPLDPTLILDGRRNRMQQFIFCPFCGEKIDWVGIRKRAKIEKN